MKGRGATNPDTNERRIGEKTDISDGLISTKSLRKKRSSGHSKANTDSFSKSEWDRRRERNEGNEEWNDIRVAKDSEMDFA